MEVGINEFVLDYPSKDEALYIFERIAREGISKLRG